MTQNTHSLTPISAETLTRQMSRFVAEPQPIPEGFINIKAVADVGMLVEPLNAAAFVFQLPDTMHRFESLPGSGTDAIRQRILASVFFDDLVSKTQELQGSAPVIPAQHAMAPTPSTPAISTPRRTARPR